MPALSPEIIALLAVLVLVQVSLQVWCVFAILRTPEAALRGGKRWIWILVVLVGEILGPLAFLAFGRVPLAEADPRSTPDASAADRLYGDQ